MKKHLIPVIALAILTGVAWHKILFQSLMGEGFFYFTHGVKEAGFPDIILRHDTGARLIFEFLKITFKDTLFFYQLLAFLTFIVLSILFYFLVYELSSGKLLSFLATLFFSVNFLGKFEMFAIGNYQFFIGRVFFFLLLFPSFILFVRYVRTGKEYVFIFSLLLYTLSLILTQFSIFLLPLFLTYAFALFLVEKKIYKRIFFYPFVTFIIVYADILYGSGSLIKGQNFFTFLTSERYTIVQQLLYQFTVLFIPHQLIESLRKELQLPFSMMVPFLYFPTLLIFIPVSIYLFVREKTLRVALITATLFIPIVFILNSYTRGTAFIGSIQSISRYLFVPSIGSSIIWATFFYPLFSMRAFLLKVFIVLLIVFFTYSDINLIWMQINEDFYKHIAAKKSLQYIKNTSASFSEDSLIVVPTNLGFHGSEFSQIFYSKAKTIFMPFNSDWHTVPKRPFDPNKDFILEYDYNTNQVIDKTRDYKEIIRKK